MRSATKYLYFDSVQLLRIRRKNQEKTPASHRVESNYPLPRHRARLALRLGEKGTAHLETTLAGGEVRTLRPGGSALLNFLVAFGKDGFDVARVSHVGVDLLT